MIASVKILNARCEVEATAEDARRWFPQSFIVEFWHRMYEQAPSDSFRRLYAQRVVEEETRLEAIKRVKVLSP